MLKLKLRHHKVIFTVTKYAVLFILGIFFGVLCFTDPELLCKPAGSETLNKIPVTLTSRKSHTLVVIIFSAPNNQVRRQAIRKTWLLTKGTLDIRHFFVIGSASLSSKEIKGLQAEHSKFEDMLLLENASDSFSKLSQKLIEALRWLDNHVNFVFLLKVDDDSFVRLDALHLKIQQRQTEKLYWGFFDGQATVKRKGKWRESNWFLCDHYLPYTKGGGYILTKDLVTKIAKMSDLTLYRNEDVALGTWLSPFNITRMHDPLFDTEYLSRGCNNAYLVTHKQSTAMMISKYNNILKFGKMCMSEYRSRNSYVYNWNNPPSLCCNRSDSSIP